MRKNENMVDTKKYPIRQSQMYPFRVGLALSNEVREKIELLRSQGRDTGEIMRRAITDYLADVVVPAKNSKAG